MKVQDAVMQIITENPHLDNEGVAEKVQEMLGTATSAASVSSIKSGLKKKGLLNSTAVSAPTTTDVAIEIPEEDEDTRSERIRRRFNTLERMAQRVTRAELPALIVSGPPGLGKSYTVEQVLKETREEDTYDILCGTVSAVGLLIALWEQREGGVIVLDDCDDVFRDETCLNLLKAVLDSSENRVVSYRKKAHWMEEMGIPTKFEFNGSVVFCTNIDFEVAIRKGSNMAPHFEALIDRSLYLSLTMRTKADFITRIRHVALEDGMLEKAGLSFDEAFELMTFVESNTERFYGLSLRLVHQMAICMKADPENWKDDIEATKMRTI